MKNLTKNKIAAILIVLNTLPQTILAYSWIVTNSPMIANMGIGFATFGFGLMLAGFMTAFGVWQDQKVYKLLAMVIHGVNALSALPGILFAPTLGWRLSALSALVIFVGLLVLLLRRTPKPITA